MIERKKGRMKRKKILLTILVAFTLCSSTAVFAAGDFAWDPRISTHGPWPTCPISRPDSPPGSRSGTH